MQVAYLHTYIITSWCHIFISTTAIYWLVFVYDSVTQMLIGCSVPLAGAWHL